MPYTYIKMQDVDLPMYSYTQGVVVFEDATAFEFVHNFPAEGPVTVEKLLTSWEGSCSNRALSSFVDFVARWRNSRKWGFLKNKHFFNCFAVPKEKIRIEEGSSATRN